MTKSGRTNLIVLTSVLVVTLAAIGFHGTNAQTNEQLGIEITTNTATDPLYLPVALSTQKNRLYATIPVQNGGEVSAIRIVPVMKGSRVKFDVYAVSGDLSKAQSCADRLLLPSKLAASHTGGKYQTITVNGEGWWANIRVVEKRADPTLSKNPANGASFVKTSAQVEPVAGDCGCAGCAGGIRCCPNKGDCMQCPCGTVCCTGS
ncbi:MAG TPA: hypothetical protein VNA19_09085 [Pyrinomonadaceae bacterium]|jgi:hypothetical protein|nr:hypothetical protein [Pyrinomonadaceae bacterium]